MFWLGIHEANRLIWFAGLHFRRRDSSKLSCVYRKQQIPSCAVLVSYAPFVSEHGRLRGAYHSFVVEEDCVQVFGPKAPDAALGAAERIGFHSALAGPEQERARLDAEALRCLARCEPSRWRGTL
jgi:hypothetical protein